MCCWGEHPKDLYQVSRHLPCLHRLAQDRIFQRAYRQKWVSRLEQQQAPTQIKRIQMEGCLGLAALRRPCLFFELDLLLRHLLVVQDYPTARWVLLQLSSMEGIDTRITSRVLHHARMTPALRHFIFDLKLASVTDYLSLCPEEIEEYIYRHFENYTNLFINLISSCLRENNNRSDLDLTQKEKFALVEFYLGAELEINAVELTSYCIKKNHLALVKLCLERLHFSLGELCQLEDIACHHAEVLAWLEEKIPPVPDVLDVNEVPGQDYYIDPTYHLAVIHPLNPQVIGVAIGSDGQIFPLASWQSRLARRLGLLE